VIGANKSENETARETVGEKEEKNEI
jgi:hypothetical protein